jgi:hypothetical protein
MLARAAQPVKDQMIAAAYKRTQELGDYHGRADM